MTQRLDQFIAQNTGRSRKDAKKIIKLKHVSINNKLCIDPGQKLTQNDTVDINGEEVTPLGNLYIALYKPADYCSSHVDDGYPSLFHLLPAEYLIQKLHIAGRLDADTTGLVLLSHDTQWCHRITHPKNHKAKAFGKTYLVSLKHPLSEADQKLLEEGVQLNGDARKTAPCSIQRVSALQVKMTLFEGRYHQVKRMFAAVGNRVLSLHRESIASIQLEPLAPGESRLLSQEEIAEFYV